LLKHRSLLPSRVEQALAELAAQGWVTSDSFEGLRALLLPPEKRTPFGDRSRKRRHKAVTSVEFAGRWSLLRHVEEWRNGSANSTGYGVSTSAALDQDAQASRTRRLPEGAAVNRRAWGTSDAHELRSESAESRTASAADKPTRDDAVETFARALLRRYGVVFRRVLEHESLKVSWYELGRVYRRLEARGEIRGGHFVGGVSGEQFAVPEAIGLLRSIRKSALTGELQVINGADPLNLAGILTPGRRVACIAANRILLRDGVPIAALEGGEVVSLELESTEVEDRVKRALRLGTMPGPLRPYYA